jgi:predicted nucleic acid-binding protein
VIVLDASVLANALADDHHDGAQARDALRQAGALAAPDLIDVQTMAVLRTRWRAETLSDSRLHAAIDDLGALALDRYPALALIRRIAELPAHVTAYDAAYVALAEVLDCELVTADQRLSKATGPRCSITLVR